MVIASISEIIQINGSETARIKDIIQINRSEGRLMEVYGPQSETSFFK